MLLTYRRQGSTSSAKIIAKFPRTPERKAQAAVRCRHFVGRPVNGSRGLDCCHFHSSLLVNMATPRLNVR
jgi:hypothetical protein